ncbi:MAG: hypothetical protein FWE90_13395 [Defluviitaleaceae bacterium]|nr:hypothetical protein [Defluviitaleaceae bacterium]
MTTHDKFFILFHPWRHGFDIPRKRSASEQTEQRDGFMAQNPHGFCAGVWGIPQQAAGGGNEVTDHTPCLLD